MFIQICILIAGLVLILAGAVFLVDGASAIARRLRISEFVIGLVIVGIGTSTPEMAVSFLSAVRGNADMAVGNIVGSNIFNTMFILGLTALVSPIAITQSNLRRDIPMNIIATMMLIFMGINSTIFGLGGNILCRIDGAVFLAVFAFYMYLLLKNGRQEVTEEDIRKTEPQKTAVASIMVAGGLAALVFGGDILVGSASRLAAMAGLSDSFIAITVLAGGTSLPELAASVTAAVKGKGQLALGNILGSNISNILLILGGAALIRPLSLSGISTIDLAMVLLGAIFIMACAYLFRKNLIDRFEGLIFLVMGGCYMTWLFMSV